MTAVIEQYPDSQKYPDSQIKELKDAFRLFDRDDNGSITKEELASVMNNLGQFPSQAELDEMLREVDIDGDGTFTFEEFVSVMANMGGIDVNTDEDEEEELRRAFKLFDRCGRGYIGASDLRVILESLGEELAEEEIDEMIAEVDLDGDGRIDFEEFIACLREEENVRGSEDEDEDGYDDQQEPEVQDEECNDNEATQTGTTSSDNTSSAQEEEVSNDAYREMSQSQNGNGTTVNDNGHVPESPKSGVSAPS